MKIKSSKLLITAGVFTAALYLGYTFPIYKSEAVQAAGSLKIETIATGLKSPMVALFPDAGNDRMLVADQAGQIWVFNKGKVMESAFLDLEKKMTKLDSDYDERGILGMALHPDFKNNRKFYIFYTVPTTTPKSDHKNVVSEFTVSANDPNKADPASEKVLLTFDHPLDGHDNHDGGCLNFGPDGYLYISVGDGGGANDEHGTIGNGQDMMAWHGKMLRIDVNKGNPYTVPADNPFVGKTGIRPEIWAYGLRNTWRYSFDKKSGLLFASDVGQTAWEEVDIIEKGGNYGWRQMEGTHCFNPATGCKIQGMKMPINEYPHNVGISITGGYVYNGKALPQFAGQYIFADWSGPLFALKKTGTTWTRNTINITNKKDDFRVLGFAEDNSGELYILGNLGAGTMEKKGVVYKLVKP
jgi:glucose/arabinose dehydrogenase